MDFLAHMLRTFLDFLLHLWQTFLALHPWAYVTAAFLAVVALIKRKAISAVFAAVWSKFKRDFWAWVSKNVQLPQSEQPHLKTYSGTFHGYFQYENFPRDWFFELVGNGFITKVPVHPTQLLSGVTPGQFVEIDTEVLSGSTVELVRRVRVDATH